MYFSDNHTHSVCSPDGYDSMKKMAEDAVKNGLDELTITDHCDLLSMEGTITLDFDWAPLRSQFAEAGDYADGKLRLNYGIEIGGASEFPDTADSILAEPLDFVLGSVHNYSVPAGYQDFYNVNYAGKPELIRAALEDYFGSIERTVAWNGFDSLAHLPYLLRYFRRDGMPTDLSGCEERIRAILRTVARNGKALELNTYRGKQVEDYRAVMTWFREEGGELVTLGSDAHHSEDTGKGIPAAQAMLKEIGFREFCIFRKRKPYLIPL